MRDEELLCVFISLIDLLRRLKHLSPEMSLKNEDQNDLSPKDSVKGNDQYRAPSGIHLEPEEESRNDFWQFEPSNLFRHPRIHLEPQEKSDNNFKKFVIKKTREELPVQFNQSQKYHFWFPSCFAVAPKI